MTPSLIVLLAAISMHPAAPARAGAASASHRVATAVPQESTAPRVWTNDDLPALEANVPITTFRTATAAPQAAVTPAGAYIKELDPEWYRAQIAARENVIAADRDRIRSLQLARESGAGLTGTVPTEAPMTIDADETMRNLQTQLKLMNIEISNLEDLARQNSIPPGAMR
jgi:hypothetical protein